MYYRTKDVRDIHEYVGATVQGKPLPIKDISLKQRNNNLGSSQENSHEFNNQNENNLRKNQQSFLQRQDTMQSNKLSVHASTIRM